MMYSDLTQSQQLIWTGQQLNPSSPQYNMAFSFEFRSHIDVDKFKYSFRKLVEQLDAMRSVFPVIAGVPKLLIKDKIDFDFEIFHQDLNQAKDWMNKQVQKSFKLDECLFDSAIFVHGENYYTFYINQHHLITDGWSYTIQYDLLLKIYNGIETDSPSFQEYLLNKPTINENAKAYWLKDFQETSVPIFNEKKNEVFNPRSERIYHTLSKSETAQIKTVVLEKGLRTWSVDLGVFNLLLSVLSATVAKLTSYKDLVIGSPTLNRPNKKLKQTVGVFIEMFPIHVPIKTGETYESLYQSTLKSSYNFLRYALPETSTSALNRSFNVVLNYINASFPKHDGIEMEASWLHSGANDPGHHVQVQVIDFNDDQEITFGFDLNDEVFNEDEKAVFIDAFLAELSHFLKDRNHLLFDSDKEELAFIDAINNTHQDFPHKGLLAYFDENVNASPDSPALVFESETMSFKTLDEQSTQLASYLMSLGVKAGSKIGLFFPRSFEMIISILAILKTQAAYIPIDISYPKRRIQFIAEEADIAVILCKNSEKDLLEIENVRTIAVDSELEVITSVPKVNIDLNYYPEQLMYIIYTSGSTGTPKGVMNKHEGVMNRLNWAKKEEHLTASDSILQKTTYTFDVSGIELLMPLMVGCKMVIASPDGHKDPEYLKSIILSERITYIHFVPSMLEVFLLNMEGVKFPALKRVICSGEALQVNHVQKFKKLFPGVILQNLYGPTESAIEVASWIAPDDVHDLIRIPIGKPIDNVQLKIIDKNRNKCGFGVSGELLIGGIQVAGGYVNKPELTDEKFIKDELGMRWYKTGDLCQWKKDGNIDYLGRIDHQVKVRGFRVELGEIEQVSKELEAVTGCVALVKNDQILAFVVQNSEVDLKAHLIESLPDYMVPSNIVVVEEIPTLDNGKIDRKKLLALPLGLESLEKPRNEFEDFVYDVWCKVLNISGFGIKDVFFDIGGDSLKGIRVITSINAELDLELPIVTIFQKLTIASLAEFIEAEIDKRMTEA